jgi:hypothetical protein
MLESLVKFGPGLILGVIGAGLAVYIFNRRFRQMPEEDQKKH